MSNVENSVTDFLFGDELAKFITSGNSVVAATRSAALEPCATRVCGLRIVGNDRIDILLPRGTGARAIANLADNGEIAVSVSSPIDYRTVQMKGHYLGSREGSAEDLLLSQERLRAFSANCATLGMSREKIR